MTKRSKRSGKRQKGKQSRRQAPARRSGSAATHVPSASTLFRFGLLDPSVAGLMDKATSLLKPVLWARDGGDVRQIRQAKTAQQVLDLLPLARGLGEPEWYKRMRQFGAEVVPLISERLRTVKEIRDEDDRDMAVEKLIGVLRPHGDTGAEVLRERFDDLNKYGQSLACVMWGLLGSAENADRIWRFYQKTVFDRHDLFFVGALWGLIDLHDERAGRALVDLLKNKHFFYELFGFLSLAGDARAVTPLMDEINQRRDKDQADPMMALIGVAHHLGREALLAEFAREVAPYDLNDEVIGLADDLLAKPITSVREYFALFYRGLTAEDLARAIPDSV
jgi:hypothetical protein